MQSSASLGASCAANPQTFLYMSGLVSLKVLCMCDVRVFSRWMLYLNACSPVARHPSPSLHFSLFHDLLRRALTLVLCTTSVLDYQ